MQNVKKKPARLSAIRSLLQKNDIRTQDELLALLESRGFELTQATLSRDMKSLNVVRVLKSGSYCYKIPTESPARYLPSHSKASCAVFSLALSGNLAVVKTLPGYASIVGALIDNDCKYDGILGTVAGDDTLLVVLKEGVTPEELDEAVSPIIPEILNIKK